MNAICQPFWGATLERPRPSWRVAIDALKSRLARRAPSFSIKQCPPARAGGPDQPPDQPIGEPASDAFWEDPMFWVLVFMH